MSTNRKTLINRLCSVVTLVGAMVELSLGGSALRAAQLDSSLFNHQYNGDVVLANNFLPHYTPDNPFDLQAPTTDGNILTYQSSIAQANGDWNSDQWNTDISHAAGWTIEFRLQLEGTGPINGFNNFADDGTSYAFFSVGPASFQLFSNPNPIDTNSNVDAFHTFRIAEAPNSTTLSVWRDGVSLGTFTAPTLAVTAMWFGDGTTSGGGPTVHLDYFRWDSTGAYAPVPVPEPSAGVLLTLGAIGLAAMARRRRT
jgi:hypothetical protein